MLGAVPLDLRDASIPRLGSRRVRRTLTERVDDVAGLVTPHTQRARRHRNRDLVASRQRSLPGAATAEVRGRSASLALGDGATLPVVPPTVPVSRG